MKTFHSMAEIIPEGTLPTASIEHFEVSKEASQHTAMRAAFGRPSEYVPEGRYCRLKVGRTVMMSDTWMEQRMNIDVVLRAHGKVLIAGLGIGMVLLPILAKPEVTSVLVIELNPDVVQLVEVAIRHAAGSNADKLQVIVADIFDWDPPKGELWDMIYFDIWPTICTDNLRDMTKLHRKFARRKNPGAWMNSWQREHLMREKRREGGSDDS